MDRGLHLGIEVLHAEADAIEAQLREQRHPFVVDAARIDLDRMLAVRPQIEVPVQRAHDLPHFGGIEEGRRTAAPVRLHHGPALAQAGCHQRHLARQIADIARTAAVIARDDLVAAAVVADVLAERDMQVERQRRVGAPCPAIVQRRQVRVLAEAGMEAIGGRIGRVARSVDVDPLGEPAEKCEVGAADDGVGSGGGSGMEGGRCHAAAF